MTVLHLVEPPTTPSRSSGSPAPGIVRTIDGIYDLAYRAERSIAAAGELAELVQTEHERLHEEGWAVCSNGVCRAAQRLLA